MNDTVLVVEIIKGKGKEKITNEKNQIGRILKLVVSKRDKS